MMRYGQRRSYQCHFCGRFTDEAVFVWLDGSQKILCIRCFLSYTLHETVRDMLDHGNEDDFRSVVRVLEGINDLIEDNPLVQAIRYVIDTWAQKYPQPLYLDELERKWKYRQTIDKVVEYLRMEEIFSKARFPGSDREFLAPGPILKSLLKRFPSSRGFFQDVVKAITGLAVIKYLSDPQSLKLRMIYATLQAIGVCAKNKKEVYYEIKGYTCKLCNATFKTREEIRTHILRDHGYEIAWNNIDECLHKYISEIKGKPLGILCKYFLFIEKANVYGVRSITKYLRYLLTRGAILPRAGNEAIMDKNGEKYVIVDLAWIRVRERMRTLEKQLIRTR